MNWSALLLLVWLLGVVFWDFFKRKVSNAWLFIAGLLCVVLYVFDLRIGSEGWLNGAQGALVAFVALIPFYILRWMGAGDVKFGLVLGFWLGLSSNLLWIWIGGSLLAGLHGLSVVLWQTLIRRPEVQMMVSALGSVVQRNFSGFDGLFAGPESRLRFGFRGLEVKRSIPYAAYMAIAAICLLLTGRFSG